MAQWRKVIVSGSTAELNGLTLSGDLTVTGGDITLGATSIFSGGDTAQLNNIDALDATTEATIEAAIDTLSNLTAASALVTVSTLSSGAISSGFGAIDIGTSTLNAGNTTVDTLVNDSSVAASRITGSFSGSFVGDGSNLTGVAQDIDSLSALGSATLHQTQDFFHFSDNGTEKKLTFSNLEDSVFANVSGDIAIAAGGAATIQANSVALTTDTTGDYVGTITGGTGVDSTAATSGEGTTHTLSVDLNELTTESSIAQADFVTMVDATDDGSGKITFSDFEDEIFGNVSGDILIAAGGAATIQANSVALTTDTTGDYVATIAGGTGIDSSASGEGAATTLTLDLNELGTETSIADDDFIAMVDATDNGSQKITFENLEDAIFSSVSGDVLITEAGVSSIQANSVALATDTTGDYVRNLTAGAGLASSGATSGENIAHSLTLDISQFSDVQIASGDKVLVLDSNGSTEQLESIDDIATLFAGDALAASSAVLAVQVDDTTIETNSDALRAKTAAIADGGAALATADQIHTFYTAGGSNLASAFNTDLGGDFTIGNQSSDTATFSGAVTITGNLDVNGTMTTIDSTNLRVADKFILAASGSTSGDGGLIIQTAAGGTGTALGYDDSASRWGLTKADDTAEDATSITPRQYVVSVSGSATDASGNPSDFGSSATDRIGMMHVNTSTGDIFIFS